MGNKSKFAYKARKWAVEKLGGTMEIPMPKEPFKAVEYNCPIVELIAMEKIEPCYETINGFEYAKDRLIQSIASMISDKHFYTMWTERDFGSFDRVCMKVSVARPPKEEK